MTDADVLGTKTSMCPFGSDDELASAILADCQLVYGWDGNKTRDCRQIGGV